MGEIHHLVRTYGREQAKDLVDPEDRRLVDVAAEILSEECGGVDLTYSGFALISLPHKDPKTPVWERRNGKCSLLLQAGKIYVGGRWVDVGVPYGSRARLLLLYIQTEAIRTGSPSVSLGRSLHEWHSRMGLSVGGSTYAAIREQARRIAGCRLSFGWQSDTGLDGFQHAAIVNGAMFVPESDGAQGELIEERCELSEVFFENLKNHPVPLFAPAIRAIANRSAAIDIYIWLAYRLRALTGPTMVPWGSLYAQFGGGYGTIRQFRMNFLLCLKEALAVYPEARLDVRKEGLLLHPSPSPVAERTHQVILPRQARF